MSIFLESSSLKVWVKEAGAELISVFNKKNNREYLWQADDKVWPRHAPILFPIVGKLKDQKYKYDLQEFQLPQHGFARDKDFRIKNNSSTTVEFELQEDASSLQNYPFKFNLDVKYELEESTLKVTYTVKNADNKPMPFSIGAHPGFKCPVGQDEKYEDYYLEFEKEEDLSTWLLKDGLLSGETESMGANVKSISLSKKLFQKDALVLKNLKSEKISLKSSKSTYAVEFDFPGFPYLGLWTKPGTDQFVCIEPWHGVADNIEATGDIFKKEGIKVIQPEEEFSCSYSVRIR